MVTRKRPEDPRRRFYPLAKSMEKTSDRIRRMCHNQAYWQHEINHRHVMPLDDAVWLRFVREDGPAGPVSFYIELTRHKKPTREGLVYWWPVIEQWRAKLIEWQGPWSGGGIGYLIVQMHCMKKNGAKYSKIADWLNGLLRKEMQNGRAGQLLAYFFPKGNHAEVIDTPQPISAAKVRELLRYLPKKSR